MTKAKRELSATCDDSGMWQWFCGVPCFIAHNAKLQQEFRNADYLPGSKCGHCGKALEAA